MLDDIAPCAPRGVIRLESCATCGAAEPILGAPGKGRPLDTFAPGYFCPGHAMYVE